MDLDPLRSLRSLIFTGDAAGLVAFLTRSPWPNDTLQLVGDGLLEAVRQRADGAVELAEECLRQLGERDWDGDRELAEALAAALGTRPTPLLRPLPVDLEELATILEGDPVYGGGAVDRRTGEVWPRSILDDPDGLEEELDVDDDERWLWVESEGSRDGYADMVRFIDALDDPLFADRLTRAISGRGPFRRFMDTVSLRPELLTRWHAFSTERQRGRARSWLAEAGYAPTHGDAGADSK